MKVPLKAAKSLDTGLNHCIAVSVCGLEIYTWGRGIDGQLGVGYIKATPDPMVVKNFKGLVIGVSAGFNHSAAVTDEGLVYVWGKGMASVLKRSVSSGEICCCCLNSYLVFLFFLLFLTRYNE